MRINFFRLLFAAIILAGSSSCVPYPPLHLAVSENTPLPEKQNDVKATAATGTEAYGFQGSWAVTKNIVLMGGYSNGNNEAVTHIDYFVTYINNNTRSSSEIGGGYYWHPDSNITLELLGGVDFFNRYFTLNDLETRYSDTAFVNIRKPFLQFDAGFKVSPKGYIIGSLKIGDAIPYNSFYSHKDDNFNQFTYRTNLTASSVIEPSMGYRHCGRYLDFNVQLGLYASSQFYGPWGESSSGNPLFIDFGLCLHLKGDMWNEPSQTDYDIWPDANKKLQ